MNIVQLKKIAERLLAPHFDAIAKEANKAIDKMELKATEAFHDDVVMERIFHNIHGSLPFVVRTAINETNFVRFCMDNRERFITRCTSLSHDNDVDKK
ncbi:hypothetical protein MNBD_GAMMA16-1888 [hydrothermal vent metagenome]|uniref:Uncharacterized protein n=1 Tax=hydrothermal vent metagenome TaxID=652676 RepID=A0A3B0ZJL4_9ZZZZ